MRKERGGYSNALFGRMADSCLKAHSLWKTGGKTSCPQPDQNWRQCPEFLLTFKVPSFGKRRWLPSSHSFRQLSLRPDTVHLQVLFWNLCVWPVLPSAVWLRGQWSHIYISWYLHQVGKRVPWVYISLGCGMELVLSQNAQLTSQTSTCSRRVPTPCPSANPFFSPG